jgi:tetratricopeptide (TPR) repeat protein
MRTSLICGVLVSAVLAGPVLAAEPPLPPAAASSGSVVKSARLDTLFARLKSATSVDDGKATERQIVVEWLKSGDEQTDRMMLQAIVAMDTGALDQALALLDRIVAAHPDYVEGWNKRATLYYMIDDYDNSLADIEKTLKLEPRHFGALAGLGMIMIERGETARALTAFEKAYEVDPVITNGKEMIEQLKSKLGKDI